MERKELELINGKIVTIMEQPTSYVLGLERRFSVRELPKKCAEILKYPSNVNPTIDELVNFPVTLTVKDKEISLVKPNFGYDWDIIQSIMNAFSSCQIPSYPAVGEFLVKKAGYKVDDFKYRELEKIGKDTILALADYVVLTQINECFNGF